MVRKEGFEPSSLAAQASETCAYANSATFAFYFARNQDRTVSRKFVSVNFKLGLFVDGFCFDEPGIHIGKTICGEVDGWKVNAFYGARRNVGVGRLIQEDSGGLISNFFAERPVRC